MLGCAAAFGAPVFDLLSDEPATLMVAGGLAGAVLVARTAFVLARRVGE